MKSVPLVAIWVLVCHQSGSLDAPTKIRVDQENVLNAYDTESQRALRFGRHSRLYPVRCDNTPYQSKSFYALRVHRE